MKKIIHKLFFVISILFLILSLVESTYIYFVLAQKNVTNLIFKLSLTLVTICFNFVPFLFFWRFKLGIKNSFLSDKRFHKDFCKAKFLKEVKIWWLIVLVIWTLISLYLTYLYFSTNSKSFSIFYIWYFFFFFYFSFLKKIILLLCSTKPRFWMKIIIFFF